MRLIDLTERKYPMYDTYSDLSPEIIRRIIKAVSASGARVALVANEEGPEYFHVAFPDEITHMRFYEALDHKPRCINLD
jgi:hypothetical protein